MISTNGYLLLLIIIIKIIDNISMNNINNKWIYKIYCCIKYSIKMIINNFKNYLIKLNNNINNIYKNHNQKRKKNKNKIKSLKRRKNKKIKKLLKY